MAEIQMPVLSVRGVHAFYGQSHVLHGVDLTVPSNAIVSLIGRNGTGKTTTFRCITGIVRPRAGQIVFKGTDIASWPAHKIARHGISLVPEDRRIFSSLSVAENIQLASGFRRDAIDESVALFPVLGNYLSRSGAQLSGGEQQMIAIVRALLARPELLLIDEPLEGLAPQISEQIRVALSSLRGKLAILIVEQNVRWLLDLAEYHYVMNHGRIVFEGNSAQLHDRPEILNRYLGVAA